MVCKKIFISIKNFALNTLQNELKINANSTTSIVVYFTLTKLVGISAKTALLICLFL